MMCPLICEILFNIQILKYICVTNVCSSGFLYTLISVCFPQLFDVLTPFSGKEDDNFTVKKTQVAQIVFI